MNRFRSLGIGTLLSLVVLACSLGTPVAPTVSPVEQTPRSPATVTSPPQEEQTSFPSPTSSPSPVLQFTASPLPDSQITLPQATCLPDSPLSLTYLPNSDYIVEILPLEDGNFLLRGRVDDNNGTWLAKMDVDGKLLWQNVYGGDLGLLYPAPNGNFVLGFDKTSLEITPDGSVVRGYSRPWVHPNIDGSFTVTYAGSAVRYKDLQTPLWQVGIKNFGGYYQPTSDGGVIFAYAGNYNDFSVYWVPIYTDLKVIKISPEGEPIQRVYGKLVGTETLDFLRATNDGGALLAGTHAYEELGTDYDVWLMKLSASGGLSWQSTLKLAPDVESLQNIHFLKNGYLAEVSVYYGEILALVRLKPNGSLAWQKTVASSRGPVEITAAADTADGGLLLAGETWEKTNVYWLARLDAKGNLLWEKTIGYNGISGAPVNEIETILPLKNSGIILGGTTDLLGDTIVSTSSAWLARIQDSGKILGLLTLAPGKFSLVTTLGSRPNTLKDEIINKAEINLKEITVSPEQTNLQPAPACLGAGASFPTPAALPTLTPSVTPTPSFIRDLYLTDPPMKGDDVLKLQKRLLDLGYTEVGTPDGIFGKMTEAAVRRFQERNSLDVDGYVGPKTWKRLFGHDAVHAA